MSAPLLDSVVLSDATLTKAQAGMESVSTRLSLSWVTPEMVIHVLASTAVAAFAYVSHSFYGYPLSSGAFLNAHTLLGIVLGVLLTMRVVLGLQRVQAAAAAVQNFAKTCRQIAVLSTFVGETLTVSAGAEVEKKATTKFRYDLVRLLNLSYYSFQLMLNGMKLCVAPTSLKPREGGKLEQETLSAVDNPTVMVCKMIAKLLEQQAAAKRIPNEQCGVIMGKIADLIDAYHSALTLLLAPVPYTLSSFAYFFTCFFCYTVGPIIAINELGDNMQFAGMGLGLTIFYTFILSNFFFGLFEAGKTLEAPLKSLAASLATDDMGYVLSDDLSNLIDDPDVPVLLTRP